MLTTDAIFLSYSIKMIVSVKSYKRGILSLHKELLL